MQSKNNQRFQVSFQAQDNYRVMDQNGNEQLAKLSGQLMYNNQRPVVGDYVNGSPQQDFVLIEQIKPRKSKLTRQTQGTEQREHVIAANLDYVFITMSLNDDFSLTRLDRYTTLVWDSGASPIIVLTKADLVSDDERTDLVEQVENNSIGVPIIITEQDQVADALQQFEPYLDNHQNIAFVGSSGVGKSTLVNLLMQRVVAKTKGIREDDSKGRHTTTSSALHLLDNGARVIDTPGIRTVGVANVDEEATQQSFADIMELAANCRFKDCQHDQEPGCAVKAAIEAGELSSSRLNSFRKLQFESQYAGLTAKQIEKTKMDRMFSSVDGAKQFKKQLKHK